MHVFIPLSVTLYKRGNYGNQTVKQGTRSRKNPNNLKFFKRKLKFFLLHHWTNLFCFERAWSVKVRQLYHWSSLSILINIDVKAVLYSVLYFIVDVDVF